MDDTDLFTAPGCFGSALAHAEDAMECRGCRLANECGERSAAALARFRSELGIDNVARPGKPKPPRKASATTDPEPPAPAVIPIVAESMPIKVRQIIERLQKRGIDLAAELGRGVNPIPDTPGFLKVACDLLLKGGFTKQSLRAAYMAAYAWSYGTAASHAGQVFSLMTALGVATESNDRLQMRVG